MKKFVFGLILTVGCVFSLTFDYSGTTSIAQDNAGFKQPEPVTCPDGRRSSVCVAHTWRGCSSQLGCAHY